MSPFCLSVTFFHQLPTLQEVTQGVDGPAGDVEHVPKFGFSGKGAGAGSLCLQWGEGNLGLNDQLSPDDP